MDCPRCDAMETDMQMQREANRSLKSELEAKEQVIRQLRQDLARVTDDRDGWRASVQRMVADRTYVSEEV
jgi:hypothetical protein